MRDSGVAFEWNWLRRALRAVAGRISAVWAPLLASVLVNVSGASCTADPKASAPSRSSIILAVFDTTRFDDWSYLRTEPATTPVLDALSEHAHRFSRAYSLYTATIPSHVSIFTGHGALQPGTAEDSPLRQPRFGYRRSSLFTILGDHGYKTFAFSGNKNIHAETIDALKMVHVTSQRLHERMSEERIAEIFTTYGEYVADPEGLNDDERKDYERHRRVVMGDAENVNAAALAAMKEHAKKIPHSPTSSS